jgi:hypothetical protein
MNTKRFLAFAPAVLGSDAEISWACCRVPASVQGVGDGKQILMIDCEKVCWVHGRC